MKKIIRVEVGGYEVSFIRKGQRVKLISYSCPKSYGDPCLPEYIYKKALKKIKNKK